MSSGSTVLLITALSIGFFHTILGPDHYLPFVALSRARNWTMKKTALITFLCGVGHVVSSIVLGVLGIGFGMAVFRLEAIEAMRGDFAGWLLLIFGFSYSVWGVWRLIRNKPHAHLHFHFPGSLHVHKHSHSGEHIHVHETAEKKSITPWVLFIIFVFGPCEPLIPLLMYPAARGSVLLVIGVCCVFACITIGTMMTMVLGLRFGAIRIIPPRLERYSHLAAGLAIFCCGFAVTFLGL